MTTQDEIKEAYRLGREAYARVAMRSDNPFPSGSELRKPWENGWYDAKDQANDRNADWVRGKTK